jgi:hypothetical protein
VITVVTAFSLVFAVLVSLLLYIIFSLARHQRWADLKPKRWQVVCMFVTVLAMFDLSDVGFTLRRDAKTSAPASVQTPQTRCARAFDRTFTLDDAPPNAQLEFMWDTRECPNSEVDLTAIVTDVAGNSASHTVKVTVRNTNERPITSFHTDAEIYPEFGYVELISQDVKKRQFGLRDGIERFGWSMSVQNSEVWVIENGQLRSTRTAPFGAILRLEVDKGTVRYYKNGVVFFTSPRPFTTRSAVEVNLEDHLTVLGTLKVVGGYVR